jgi:hypothetical protein
MTRVSPGDRATACLRACRFFSRANPIVSIRSATVAAGLGRTFSVQTRHSLTDSQPETGAAASWVSCASSNSKVQAVLRRALSDLPDGQITDPARPACPVPFEKIFRLTRRANHFYSFARPARKRGVGHRHERWAGCGGRFWCLKDEGCESGRRSRVVLISRR